MHKALSVQSRVRGDFHARFCERVRVKLPRSTRPDDSLHRSYTLNTAKSNKFQYNLPFFFWFLLPFQNKCVYLSRQTEMMPLRRLNQGDGHIMIRRLLDAFVLTVYELRNLILFVKDKAMVNAPMGVLYAYLIIQGVLHIHLRGAFVHCSFRRIRAMRRPIDCGTSKKCGSTFFILWPL